MIVLIPVNFLILLNLSNLVILVYLVILVNLVILVIQVYLVILVVTVSLIFDIPELPAFRNIACDGSLKHFDLSLCVSLSLSSLISYSLYNVVSDMILG